MPATPLRSHAFAPAPSSSELGIMPDLYRLSVGPVNAEYYQKHFLRFEALGKPVPTWNNAAGFCTLAWLLMRKLWRPAAAYAGVLTTLLLLWWLGIHGRVPLSVEIALCSIGFAVLCALPGFLGNGLYYQHVRNQTLNTLGKASSLAQARVILTENAPTKERFQVTAAMQALIALAAAAVMAGNLNFSASPPSAAVVAAGPPDIVIPSVESLRTTELQAFIPDMALAEPEPLSADLGSAAGADAGADLSAQAALPAVTAAAPAQPTADDKLSIVQFAKAVPAAGAAAAAATTASLAPAPSAVAAPAPVAEPVASKPPAAQEKNQPSKRAVATNKSVHRQDGNRLIPNKFYLNAGVYAQASNVDNAVKRLQAAKLSTVRQTVQSSKGELTRLRIGPFDTRKQAEQAARRAKQLRIETSIYQHPKS